MMNVGHFQYHAFSRILIVFFMCIGTANSFSSEAVLQTQLTTEKSVAGTDKSDQTQNKLAEIRLSIGKKEIETSDQKNVYGLLQKQSQFAVLPDGKMTLYNFSGNVEIFLDNLVASIEKNPLALGLDAVEQIDIWVPSRNSNDKNTVSALINISTQKKRKAGTAEDCLKRCVANGIGEKDCLYICKAK
nr:hypothetical protein [uncultured Undibacterium sp.]